MLCAGGGCDLCRSGAGCRHMCAGIPAGEHSLGEALLHAHRDQHRLRAVEQTVPRVARGGHSGVLHQHGPRSLPVLPAVLSQPVLLGRVAVLHAVCLELCFVWRGGCRCYAVAPTLWEADAAPPRVPTSCGYGRGHVCRLVQLRVLHHRGIWHRGTYFHDCQHHAQCGHCRLHRLRRVALRQETRFNLPIHAAGDPVRSTDCRLLDSACVDEFPRLHRTN